MSDNQRQFQGGNAAAGSQSGASQQGQYGEQGSKPPTPGGSNPSGLGQPINQQGQSGGSSQQGASSQGRPPQSQGRGDRQGSGLDEEDITESPRRDSAQQPGSDRSDRSGDRK